MSVWGTDLNRRGEVGLRQRELLKSENPVPLAAAAILTCCLWDYFSKFWTKEQLFICRTWELLKVRAPLSFIL